MDNHNRLAGTVDDELRHWLSPLPLLMDGPKLERSPCTHDRSEACLSLLAPARVGLHLALLLLAVPAALFCVIYFAQAQSPEGILSSLAAYALLSMVILWLLLGRIMNNYAVFFHRQRREVMFLSWNRALKRTETHLLPWEQIRAWVPAASPDSCLTLELRDPSRPELYLSRVFRRWRGRDLGVPLWRAVCRYMELGPEHFPESSSPRRTEGRRPLPPELEAWRQPLPAPYHAQPSLESRWYNGYLPTLYPEHRFLDLGVIENSIPYPGPREAAEQLKEGNFFPGFGGRPELRRRQPGKTAS